MSTPPLKQRVFEVAAHPYRFITEQDIWRAHASQLLERLELESTEKGAGREVPVHGRPRRVLDLGTGPGGTLAATARGRSDVHFLGVDLSLSMLKLALRRRDVPDNVSFARVDAAHLPLESASLDGVLGHSFLYLLPDRAAVLREVFRVLKPGAKAAFMEPARVGTGRMFDALFRYTLQSIRQTMAMTAWVVFRKAASYPERAELIDVASRAGFVDIEVDTTLKGLGLHLDMRKPFVLTP